MHTTIGEKPSTTETSIDSSDETGDKNLNDIGDTMCALLKAEYLSLVYFQC